GARPEGQSERGAAGAAAAAERRDGRCWPACAGLLRGPSRNWYAKPTCYRRPMDLLRRITRDPAVMGGRPCIRGMRVTVGTIVGLLATGRTEDGILQTYPYLELEDIRAALAYAAWRAEEVELPLT